MRLDRLKDSLLALAGPLTRRIDYSAKHAATVVKQNDDGSLELAFADPGLKPLSNVAISYGVPGITVKLKSGGAVVAGFTNADPALPYALVFDQASVESISLLGGTKPVARMGDGARAALPPTATYTGTFGNEALSAAPVTMANLFTGVIDSAQEGALA